MHDERTKRLRRRRAQPKGLDRLEQTIDHWRIATSPSFVYAVAEYDIDDWHQERPTGYIKIGVANDPADRLGSLQTGNARTLGLLAVIYGTLETEQILHRHFVDAKVGATEWFDPSVADIIKQMFREIDWRQRRGALDHHELCVTIVDDVLANRPARESA